MIEKLEKLLQSLADLVESTKKSKVERVPSTLKTKISEVGRIWLHEVSATIRSEGKLADEVINQMDSKMEALYGITETSPRRTSTLNLLRQLHKSLQSDILVPLIKAGRASPSLVTAVRAKVLAITLSDDEKSYYDEAFKAAATECYKAAIVMIWCAAVARIHTKIYKEGLKTFNKASQAAKSINNGPWKYFNKEFSLGQQNELPLISEKDLILTASCMVNLEVGQTEALLKILETRNNCGHPSGYSVEEIHFVHFVTEVLNLVLNNKKFQ